jgi:hypothetical protein
VGQDRYTIFRLKSLSSPVAMAFFNSFSKRSNTVNSDGRLQNPILYVGKSCITDHSSPRATVCANIGTVKQTPKQLLQQNSSIRYPACREATVCFRLDKKIVLCAFVYVHVHVHVHVHGPMPMVPCPCPIDEMLS